MEKESMTERIRPLELRLDNELDILIAYKQAMQFSELTGLSISDQTRFATAISEICRNCIEYAGSGMLSFTIAEVEGHHYICCSIEDSGPGIENLEAILNEKNVLSGNMRGTGIANSRKLVSFFTIQSSEDGTIVRIGQRISKPKVPVAVIYNQWITKIKERIAVSPYEELKKRNTELILLSEEVLQKNREIEEQFAAITSLNDKLEKANLSLKEFAYTISHDLKTPLTNLNLWLSLGLQSEDLHKKQEALKKSQASGKRLQSTIEGLITVIDSQNLRNQPIAEFSVHQLLHETLEEFTDLLKETNGTIDLKCDADLIVYVKPYLKSILFNLVSNSLKYRSEKRPPRIKIRAHKTADFFILSISDNGLGIDLIKNFDKVFKPFARIQSQGEGKGIGLYIIKNMIEKNDGRIEVESVPDEGTTFTCFLREYR